MKREWRLGTMGFSYADWSGPFYPPGLKPGEYLEFYARHFNAVELDTTFHATPPPERVRRWAEVTPDNFRFAVKAPRTVTHDLPLGKATEPMLEFLDVMKQFGEKLAVVLLQFPPGFSSKSFDALGAFLKTIPPAVKLAVEFRHESWWADDARERTAQMLAEHEVCWASAEYVAEPRDVRPTADFLYVRWIGEHGRIAVMSQVQVDVTARLQWWKNRLTDFALGSLPVYGFFNNDFSGYAIETCNQFKAMLGMSTEPKPGTGATLFDDVS